MNDRTGNPILHNSYVFIHAGRYEGAVGRVSGITEAPGVAALSLMIKGHDGAIIGTIISPSAATVLNDEQVAKVKADGGAYLIRPRDKRHACPASRVSDHRSARTTSPYA